MRVKRLPQDVPYPVAGMAPVIRNQRVVRIQIVPFIVQTHIGTGCEDRGHFPIADEQVMSGDPAVTSWPAVTGLPDSARPEPGQVKMPCATLRAKIVGQGRR